MHLWRQFSSGTLASLLQSKNMHLRSVGLLMLSKVTDRKTKPSGTLLQTRPLDKELKAQCDLLDLTAAECEC